MEEYYKQRLEERGIKPTVVRLLIFREMARSRAAFSMHDLEERLDTIDKSTLFRTITLFHEKHLLHSIDDGSGAMKYSVCSSSCSCDMNDLHVHFTCTNCKNTFCLKNIPIPNVMLPDGFLPENVNFVLKGICPDCSKNATRLR